MLGVFDSGFGGLTILRKFQELMPNYDYIFLGDNARAPYGSRSYETVYSYTLQAVKKLFEMGCPLVILACNTASAKALRSIQQNDLQNLNPSNRVLGIIRPTAEVIANYTQTHKVGILGTQGTINSNSYVIEINKIDPTITVYQQACPMLAALVENGEINNQGTDYFVEKYVNNLINQCSEIDSIVLGCTHYPLLMESFKKFCKPNIKLIPQNEIVAKSLRDYLNRHPEMDNRLTKNASTMYLTTDDAKMFDDTASYFLGKQISSKQISL